jgi:retron-type reverse transcriptase
VLNAVYEADFKGFSYGFRPGRSQHDALDALAVGLGKRVNWVLDADIRGFFDHLDRGWLERFLRHRIADERILRLVMKWLNAGVLEAQRITDKKKMAARLKSVIAELMRRRHLPVPEQGRWLASVIRGHEAYYAVPGNAEAVAAFRYHVTRHWRFALSRRSQKGRVTWERMTRPARRYLPTTRIRHPWPEARFAARHP